jgi:hypothetical protein
VRSMPRSRAHPVSAAVRPQLGRRNSTPGAGDGTAQCGSSREEAGKDRTAPGTNIAYSTIISAERTHARPLCSTVPTRAWPDHRFVSGDPTITISLAGLWRGGRRQHRGGSIRAVHRLFLRQNGASAGASTT